jgi:Uma2 family endonuclease
MIRDGYFGPDEKCELIRGLIVHQMPRDPVHDAVLEIVLDLLRQRLPAGWRVRPQMAVVTADSQPEPDAAVVRGRPQDYFGRHPTPPDMALAVEVSNTTVASDRGTKGPLYADSKVAVYWVVNIPDRRVEVYTDPTGPDSDPAYRRREDYGEGTLVPLAIDGVAVAPIVVSDLFPPRD